MALGPSLSVRKPRGLASPGGFNPNQLPGFYDYFKTDPGSYESYAVANFDGAADYLRKTSPSGWGGQTNLSIQVWIRPTGVAGLKTILSKDTTFADRCIQIYRNTTSPRLSVHNGSSEVEVLGSGLTAGADHCIQGKWNGSQLSIRRNAGSWVNATLSGGSLKNNSSPITLGNDGALGGTSFFDGRMWGVGFWNRVLSDSEFNSLYNDQLTYDSFLLPAYSGFITGLISWWDLDEHPDLLRIDRKGTNHLTPTSSPPVALGRLVTGNIGDNAVIDLWNGGVMGSLITASGADMTTRPFLERSNLPLPMLDFDGTNDVMVIDPLGFVGPDAGWYLAYVAEFDAYPSTVFAKLDDTDVFITHTSDTQVVVSTNDGGVVSCTLTHTKQIGRAVHVFHQAGGTVKHFMDRLGQQDSDVSNAITLNQVGERLTTPNRLNGRLGEIVFGTAPLTDYQINLLGTFLSNRFNTDIFKEFADLQAEYRAEDVTLNATDVSSWTDRSGNGHHAVQGTAANQPLWNASDANFNNRPTITFNGSSDRLTADTLASVFSGDDIPLTCFIVARRPDEVNQRTIISFGRSDADSPYLALFTRHLDNDFTWEKSVLGGNQPTNGHQFVLNTTHVFAFTQYKLVYAWRDGISGSFQGEAWDEPTVSFNQFTIGCIRRLGVGEFSNLTVGTIALYKRVLSISEINTIAQELAWRYGTTWTTATLP